MQGFTLLDSEAPLGAGGYGTVVKARNNASGEIVAAKRILTTRMKMHAIEKEVGLMQKLVHPNIIGRKVISNQ